MDNYFTRAEHEEFAKRIDLENRHQNQRIDNLEEHSRKITDIVISVRELAQSVKQMAETQERQGHRLEELEDRDGEVWRKVTGYIITAVIGAILGFTLKKFGL